MGEMAKFKFQWKFSSCGLCDQWSLLERPYNTGATRYAKEKWNGEYQETENVVPMLWMTLNAFVLHNQIIILLPWFKWLALDKKIQL